MKFCKKSGRETMKEEVDPLVADKTLWGQVLDHIYLAGPVVSAYVLRRVVVMTSVIAVGHLGAHYLAAAGLASVTANVTGNSMIIGLSGALTTLCSQANGANNKKEMSIILQRAILILSIFLCIPISFLWAFSEPIMVWLGQDEVIARSTKDYMIILIPGLWALSATQCINMWLYAQAKTKAIASIALGMAILHPAWLYLLIYYWKIGFLGSAIALSLSKWVELLVLLAYMNCFSSVIAESEFAWSWEAWRQWGPFLRLGLPNLMMMTEWWASEIIIFMSGALSNPAVEMGAMSIYQNFLSLCFMLPAGIRESCSTIVGNALGADKPQIARASSIISPALAFLGCVAMSAVILPMRDQLGRMFTDDAEVVALVAALAPIIAAYVISDGVQAAYTGVIKGVGKQGIAGPIVVFSYYAVAIPLSTYLALDLHGHGLRMGVWGLCIGTLVGTIVHALSFAIIVHVYTDMEQEAARIKENSAAGAGDRERGTTLDDASVHNSTRSPLTQPEESEDGWWDDLDFLGFDDKRPGRTAVSRGAPAGGVLSYPVRLLQSAVTGVRWSLLGGGTSGGANAGAASRSNRPPLQYATGKKSRGGKGAGTSSRPAGASSARGYSEYELVRAYTDSLSPQNNQLGAEGEDEDDYLEIDFDFI